MKWLLPVLLAAIAAAAPTCNLVSGWQQQGAARAYTAEDLFEYMDGNAEGYLIYGFTRMDGVTCTKDGDTILIDVSEMADPDAAYGIFTANRHPNFPLASLGMAGQIQPRKATFVKDRFYVELSAAPDKDHTAALTQFVNAIEKTITGRTALPEAIGWFPTDRLNSLRLIPESVLGLRALRRGYAAEYAFGKAFVAAQESPAEAGAVMEKLRARIGQTAPVRVADEAFQVEDRYLGRLCFFRKGKYIGGYANVSAGMDPVALATELSRRLP